MDSTPNLKNLINNILIKHGYKNHLQKIKVKKIYQLIVGEMIANHTKSLYLKDNTLIIYTDSPVIRNEISYIKKGLSDKINHKLNTALIKKIEVY